MAQFLHIRVEDLDLLLPALQVHEVIALETDKGQGEAHALWRGQVLSRCDLGQILQRCSGSKRRAYAVIYSADKMDASPVLMLIDEVLGLRKPQPGQMHKLPGIKTDAHRWFEALWVDNQLGFKAYCVRSPLTTEVWKKQAG